MHLGRSFNLCSTNLVKGHKLGVAVEGFPESSKEELAEALTTFISVDTARALVTMDELARFLDPSSPNGQEHVTDDLRACSPAFITQVTTGNIVLWVTRLSIVDWVYSKTQTLLVTLVIQNQPRGASFVCLGVEHSSPCDGCV